MFKRKTPTTLFVALSDHGESEVQVPLSKKTIARDIIQTLQRQFPSVDLSNSTALFLEERIEGKKNQMRRSSEVIFPQSFQSRCFGDYDRPFEVMEAASTPQQPLRLVLRRLERDTLARDVALSQSKIGEDALLHYLGSICKMSGILDRRTRTGDTWVSRYFLLTQDRLWYCKVSDSKRSLAYILLSDDCSVHILTENTFQLAANAQFHTFRTARADDRDRWVFAIATRWQMVSDSDIFVAAEMQIAECERAIALADEQLIDNFSYDFDAVMRNPAMRKGLAEFTATYHCEESVLFVEEAESYRKTALRVCSMSDHHLLSEGLSDDLIDQVASDVASSLQPVFEEEDDSEEDGVEEAKTVSSPQKRSRLMSMQPASPRSLTTVARREAPGKIAPLSRTITPPKVSRRPLPRYRSLSIMPTTASPLPAVSEYQRAEADSAAAGKSSAFTSLRAAWKSFSLRPMPKSKSRSNAAVPPSGLTGRGGETEPFVVAKRIYDTYISPAAPHEIGQLPDHMRQDIEEILLKVNPQGTVPPTLFDSVLHLAYRDIKMTHFNRFHSSDSFFKWCCRAPLETFNHHQLLSPLGVAKCTECQWQWMVQTQSSSRAPSSSASPVRRGRRLTGWVRLQRLRPGMRRSLCPWRRMFAVLETGGKLVMSSTDGTEPPPVKPAVEEGEGDGWIDVDEESGEETVPTPVCVMDPVPQKEVILVATALQISTTRELGLPTEVMEILTDDSIWLICPEAASPPQWLRLLDASSPLSSVSEALGRLVALAPKEEAEEEEAAVPDGSIAGPLGVRVGGVVVHDCDDPRVTITEPTRVPVRKEDGYRREAKRWMRGLLGCWRGLVQNCVLLEGRMYKRGAVNTSWKARYCRLFSQGQLLYYRTATSTKIKGFIVLGTIIDVIDFPPAINRQEQEEKATQQAPAPNFPSFFQPPVPPEEQEETLTGRFDIICPKRRWEFRAPTLRDMQRWVVGIRAFSPPRREPPPGNQLGRLSTYFPGAEI